MGKVEKKNYEFLLNFNCYLLKKYTKEKTCKQTKPQLSKKYKKI